MKIIIVILMFVMSAYAVGTIIGEENKNNEKHPADRANTAWANISSALITIAFDAICFILLLKVL